ncbi:hypothetical protein BC835DRAFT_1311826 [Cytidiella melzeri]|nr:hypothetical protein BC835DRAFT_1311826 [Cytidiella melzeri]
MKVSHQPADDIGLKGHIRDCALRWMGRKDNKAPFHLPSRETVKTFERSSGSGTKPLKLDISTTPGTLWNKRCAVIFAREYMKLSNKKTQDIIDAKQRFVVHFKGLQRQWCKIGGANVPDQLHENAIAQTYAAKQRSRAKDLAKRRLKGALMHASSKHWVDMLEAGGAGAQSDDETVMQDGTAMAKASKMRWEIESIREGTSKSQKQPVKDLPSNCYDKDWLDGLDEEDRNNLRMREEVYLTIPVALKEAADKYKRWTDGTPTRRRAPLLRRNSPPKLPRLAFRRKISHKITTNTRTTKKTKGEDEDND